MNKILTIIVPTYNMEKYLDKCLTSLILNPSNGEDWETLMQQLEVLVIIDGATDRSSEIAHGYEARYLQTFRVIDKENGNYGSCINRGLKEATGKYIKVLDADDWFDTTVFAVYLRKLQTVDVDLVLNDMHTISINSEEQKNYDFASFFQDNRIYDFKELLKIDTPRYIAMHCLAYKTDNVRAMQYRQTEGISHTDVQWDIIPMRSVKVFVSIKGYLYNYFIGREGQTMNPKIMEQSRGQFSQVLLVLIKYMNGYTKKDTYYEYLKKEMEAHTYTLFWGMRNKKYLSTIIKTFDNEIKIIAPRIYQEMEYWTCNWYGKKIRYVAIVRHPWKVLFSELKNKGYQHFVNTLDYMAIKDMFHPRWILNAFYETKKITKKILVFMNLK